MPKDTNPLRRRSPASPFSAFQRKKPGSRKSSLAEKEDAAVRLEDNGSICSLAPRRIPQDVVSLLRHIQSYQWQTIPERAAGMNSDRIGEVLRYRTALPPVVSLAHLHALSRSSTQTEREMARLVALGVVRKVTIPGRGKGGAAVGDGVVIMQDWKDRLRTEDGVSDEVKEKYSTLMNVHPTSPTVPTSSLTRDEVRQLTTHGFLTSPSALSSSLSDLFAAPGTSSLLNISSAGTKAPTGSMAAIGGLGAVHESGGGGSTLATRDNRPSHDKLSQEMSLALPGMGAYLKLLTEARLDLLHQLRNISPRFKEATLDTLKEKWEGNVLGDAASTAKRARGEWSGVLPGKTKKWRDFYGLEFEWVLAECVGSGAMELFDTGAVGTAVRAR
ncbi:hypothetical protein B0A50_04926 [Salinomyces thailandicus]|uniref:Serine-threonine protein kinase 19 n=1 Tax=Salinomyces thailandicus TaxID=706561 RepID=A0A4U0U151_9PEZI|nr:hypothetical protein B0A50_04926 [Salinomyces thailandica]